MSAHHPTGDMAELEAIYRTHYGLVRWVLRACGIPEGSLDDRTHDVFVALCHRLPQRDPEVPMRAWVTGVARNVAFSYRRSAARRHRRAERLDPPDAPPGPDQLLERREAWRALAQFLEDLGPEQREVFVMVEVTGMRVSELAASTGMPANTLHSRLKVARTRFSEHFAGATESRAQIVQRARRQGRATPQQRRRTWGAIAASIGRAPVTLVPAAQGAVTKATGLGAGKLAAIGAAAITLGLAAVVAPRVPEPAPMPAPASIAAPVASARPGPAGSPRFSPAPSPRSEPVTPRPSEPQARPSAGAARPRRRPARPSSPALDAAPEPAPASGPVDDELAAAVQTLERARRQLRADQARQALATLDALGARFGALDRERRRVELAAACALGDASRARRAAAALARPGAAVDPSRPCDAVVD